LARITRKEQIYQLLIYARLLSEIQNILVFLVEDPPVKQIFKSNFRISSFEIPGEQKNKQAIFQNGRQSATGKQPLFRKALPAGGAARSMEKHAGGLPDR